MATVGWIGLGKLGLTCALSLAHDTDANHRIHGYDLASTPQDILWGSKPPHQEAGLPELLEAERTRPRLSIYASVGRVIEKLDGGSVVFVSAQTPHSPEYGGETPVPYETRDFEYAYLINAVREVAREAKAQQKYITLVVISTVLPGTSHKHLEPLLNEFVEFVYNPFFIAMGTTRQDFTNPEFVLLGSESEGAVAQLTSLYRTVHSRPIRPMSVESAELTKVAYNTFISMKIVFANTVMEICEKSGANADEVCQALAAADQRIASGAYMQGGMGDGGGCHPRDNVAMAHLAERLGLSADPFTFVTHAREQQSSWHAETIIKWSQLTGLHTVILGVAYKPESNLTLGSPALLLKNQLATDSIHTEVHDPYVFPTHDLTPNHEASIFFVGVKHAYHAEIKFPRGSVVIDPFGYIPDQSGVTVVRLGRN